MKSASLFTDEVCKLAYRWIEFESQAMGCYNSIMPEKLAPAIAGYIEKRLSISETKTPIGERLNFPRIETVPNPLREIAESVADISGTWNPVALYTADSESIERERDKLFDAFDKDTEYNPQFTYSKAKERADIPAQKGKLNQLLTRVRTIDRQSTDNYKKNKMERTSRHFRSALYYKIKDDLATCDLVEGINEGNEEKISRALKQKYPGTDQSLLDLANTTYLRNIRGYTPVEGERPRGLLTAEQIKWLENLKITPEQTAEAFRWILNQYGLLRTAENGKGYMARVTPDATSIDVRDKSENGPEIVIPEKRTTPMSGMLLLEISAHEIEGHVLQSMNGEELFFLGGGRLKIDNEQLYEGLGLRREFAISRKLFGKTESAPLPYFTFGVHMAEQGASFYQIFSDQLERRIRVNTKTLPDNPLPDIKSIDAGKLKSWKDQAFQATYRVMRGHTDTSNKARFATGKDLAYLRGYQMDKQMQRNGFGIVNEQAIIAQGALAMMAEYNQRPEKDLPYPFKDVITMYWEQVLKPQMESEKRERGS